VKGSQLLRGKRVLVVDDEPDLREIFCSELEFEGASTLTAANGLDAFKLVREQPIDAIVSDVRMPGGGGVDLALSIHGSDVEPKPVVFLVTGFPDRGVEDAVRKGACMVFAKPVDWDKLIRTIADSLAI
jgi:DNA-binding NtrC family response regulator